MKTLQGQMLFAVFCQVSTDVVILAETKGKVGKGEKISVNPLETDMNVRTVGYDEGMIGKKTKVLG